MSNTQDLKDCAVTLQEAYKAAIKTYRDTGKLDIDELVQLELAVDYVAITVGFATDSSYVEVLDQGVNELPLKSDGDRIWSTRGDDV